MYNIQEAFQILQIDITNDRKVIRSAYAALVKQYHPEENPTEWERIRQAYEIARAYADRAPSRKEASYEQDQAALLQQTRPAKRVEREKTAQEPTTEQESATVQKPAANQEPVIARKPTVDQEPVIARKPTVDQEPVASPEPAESWEQQEAEQFFKGRTQEKDQKLQEAEDVVLRALREMLYSQAVSYEGWYKVIHMPQMDLVLTSDAVLEEILSTLEGKYPELTACRLLKTLMQRVEKELETIQDVDSRKRKLVLVRQIEKHINIWDWQEKQKKAARAERSKNLLKFILGIVGIVIVGDVLLMVLVYILLGSDDPISQKTPQRTILTAEEMEQGAKIGDPSAVLENIMELHLGGGTYGDRMVTHSSEHHVILTQNDVPEGIELPAVWYFTGAFCFYTKDGQTDDVIACLQLDEFHLKKDGFVVYAYDAAASAYIQQDITYLGNAGDTQAEFPYVYQNVLYVRVPEYAPNGAQLRYKTVILRTVE